MKSQKMNTNMEREFVEAYMDAHYAQWLRQCRRTCFLYGAADCAEDILQDAMYGTITRNSISNLYLMAQDIGRIYTLLDLYVIRSFKNTLRNYATKTSRRDKKVVKQIDLDRLSAPENDSDAPSFDVYAAQQQLRAIIERVAMPEPAKDQIMKIAVRGDCIGLLNIPRVSIPYNAAVAQIKQHIREQRISIQ